MKLKIISFVIVCFTLFIGCGIKPKINNVKIIPLPQEIVPGSGFFNLKPSTKVFSYSSELSGMRETYQRVLKIQTGIEIGISLKPLSSNSISLVFDKDILPEAYKVEVNTKQIIVKAGTQSGAFYALQTIKQLIPVEFAGNIKPINSKCKIPVVNISDKPAFVWRGYMLDVSRHFFAKEKIKEVLDFMASIKLNRFHWHLADDQGWRIEIDKYPKLTSVGAWRVDYNTHDETVSNWWGRPVQKDGEVATYGGFYTKEDIKEIIKYAKERYIEILPEIDVPGHSREILASYPELSCQGRGNFKVATGGITTDNALCPYREYTYEFLSDVVDEVIELFPFEYIHIGGDECNTAIWTKYKECDVFMKKNGIKDVHELQSYFTKRIEKIVNAKGKKIVGWDEILNGGIAPNATVMSWRGEKGGIAASKAGHYVIMAPSTYNYLDFKQGQSDFEPNLGYSKLSLSKCYNYSVIPKELTKEESKYILGTQGNLWSESISDWGKLTYMTFPRLFAVAENGWTPESEQNFDDFIDRLSPQLKRLKANKIRYANSVYNVWVYQKGNGKTIKITLDSELSDPDIRYTLDGSSPCATSIKYVAPFELTTSKTLKTAIFKDGEMLGKVVSVWYPIHKAAGAKVLYHSMYSKKDPAGGKTALTDLNYGQADVGGDHNWQGFDKDMDVEVVFDKPVDIKTTRIISLKKTIRGIYPPSRIELFGSTDGVKYKKIGDSGFLKTSQIQGRNRIPIDIECNAKNIKNLRVKAKIVSPIPLGHHMAGKNGYLKVDEIIVL